MDGPIRTADGKRAPDDDDARSESQPQEPQPAPPAGVHSPQGLIALQQAAGNRAAVAALGSRSVQVAAKGRDEDRADAELRVRAEALLTEAASTMADATDFQKRATTEMGRVHKDVVAYLATYRKAHDDVAADLGKAHEEAERQAAMLDAVSGILIGTGVGMVLPRLIGGYRKMRTVGLLSKAAAPELKLAGEVTSEVAGETAELGIGAVVGPDAAKPFELPPELSVDLVASQQWQQLAEGWKTLAEAGPGITEFGNARYALLEQLHKPLGADQLRSLVQGWTERNSIALMRDAVTEADDALAAYLAVMDTPILRRTEWSIGQDLLIKWIVSLAPKSERDPDRVSGKDLDTIDDVESVLAKWGVLAGPAYISAPGDATRLGVDFGDMWTSRDDQVDAYKAAVWEKRRIAQIGRLGVIVRAADGPRPALVSLQHAAYLVTGRPDPYAGATEWRFACSQMTSGEPLVPGLVVVVAGTALRQVFVDPVKGAAPMPYGPIQIHPRSARELEKQKAEKRRTWQAAQTDYGPVPVDDAELERHGIDPTEARFLPDEVLASVYGLPTRAPQAASEPPAPPPAGADESGSEAVCLTPDQYDAAVSREDPRLDPDAVELCFGDAAP